MSRRNNGSTWSAALLKRRGWTNELIRDLLPKPRRILHGGQTVRVWSKEDVRAAEASPRFLAARAGEERPAGPLPAELADAAERAAAALAEAWAAAETDEAPAWLLGRSHHLFQGGRAQRGRGPARRGQGAGDHLRGPALRHPPQANGGVS